MDVDRVCSHLLASQRGVCSLPERGMPAMRSTGQQRIQRSQALRARPGARVRTAPAPVCALPRKKASQAARAGLSAPRELGPLATSSSGERAGFEVWDARVGRPTEAELAPSELHRQVEALERTLQASNYLFERAGSSTSEASSRSSSNSGSTVKRRGPGRPPNALRGAGAAVDSTGAAPGAGGALSPSPPSTSGRELGAGSARLPIVHSTKRAPGRGRGRPPKAATATEAATEAVDAPAAAPRRRSASASAGAATRSAARGKSSRRGAGKASPRDAEGAFLAAMRERLERGRRHYRSQRIASTSDAVSMFLYNIGNTGILTKDEEAALARILRKGTALEEVCASLTEQLGRAPAALELAAELQLPLSGGEAGAGGDAAEAAAEAALARVACNGTEAKDLMVQYNLRLVVAIAKKYTGRGVEFGDLIPEGMAGLMKAVDKFDPDRGFKFSTYAHWWIRQAVSRCVSDHSRVVRLPVHVYDILGKINKVAQELNSQVGRTGPASYSEIGAALGMSGAKVLQYVRAAKPARSLDTPAYSAAGHKPTDADAQLLVDTIATEPTPEADEYSRAIDKIIREDINALLSTLPPRERNVIRMRYGLHSAEGRCMTFNDIGAAYGLTKERIRQIEDKALSKLRRPWRRKLLRPHLYGGMAE